MIEKNTKKNKISKNEKNELHNLIGKFLDINRFIIDKQFAIFNIFSIYFL